MKYNEKIAKRVAEGTTAKLNFDYSCNRGHLFGEYHLHTIFNEIISSNVDNDNHEVHGGYAHPLLQSKGGTRGRKQEIDFAVIHRRDRTIYIAAEIKWAGSSHCSIESIFKDLLRLQIIANKDKDVICFFLLSGREDNINSLFDDKILSPGMRSMFVVPANNFNINRSPKNFPLSNNPDHQDRINKLLRRTRNNFHVTLPTSIRTLLTDTRLSAFDNGRFKSYSWVVQAVP
ncbi:MAG: hypothetical protein HQL90_15375 [Magnetococcales bacterium]|nr:hypothetical protein [Magnetococcales bacterium]